jgi:UDP-MurNAc hydroxylase
MDPWFVDGEYYGSWCHYPKLNIDIELINSCNFIYISHIHPDHFSRKSLELVNKNIPVLILNYTSKFLKFNIEKLGFRVIEIDHNEDFIIYKDFKIRILAADNCNPELCGKFFGCSNVENSYQTTQIDSLAVFHSLENVILNVNDCPFELAEKTLNLIQKDFEKIDLLLVGYAGAGPFPQCFKLNTVDKLQFANEKKLKFLEQGLNFINTINPKYYLPFAGTYTLSGNLSHLNKFRGVPDIEEALDYFKSNISRSQGFLLNAYEYFDLSAFSHSKKYVSYKSEKDKYINENLLHLKMDFENDPYPTYSDIIKLIPESHKRFLNKIEEIGFRSNTVIFISLPSSKDLKIYLNGNNTYDIVDSNDYTFNDRYLRIETDFRLLLRLLKGPRYAHWNNAEIGSHLFIDRNPNIFERGLFYSLYSFHI